MTVRDALNSALDEELARDEKVFILGEEVMKVAQIVAMGDMLYVNIATTAFYVLRSANTKELTR